MRPLSFLKKKGGSGTSVKDEDVEKMEASFQRVWLASKGFNIDMQPSPEADASGPGQPGQSRAHSHSNENITKTPTHSTLPVGKE